MDANDRMNEPMDRTTNALDDAAAPRATARTGAAGTDLGADLGTEYDAGVGNPGDEIGEAVGGISGVLTGAALGSLGGPVGTIIGGIAGAVSGWWAGRAISDAASHATDEDDAYYRSHYTTSGTAGTSRTVDGRGVTPTVSAAATRDADAGIGHATGAASGMGGVTRGYDDVRPAYQIGHLAGRNPDYAGRSFDDVEPDLQRGWTPEVSARYGAWHEVRDYARSAYDRSRGTATRPVGGAEDLAARALDPNGRSAT